jgi:hypothetical protein
VSKWLSEWVNERDSYASERNHSRTCVWQFRMWQLAVMTENMTI